ncbi:hypothetical protein DFH08DRAFT_53593 [Mycena albidolilacea]|uniref:Uncharacterized protein n=1 Tax=Mycena albidolilacea TaxID=1033008 RepID=A0AAD7E9U3_9AGAR|nr:hypothetical protein DFH08DRAFT_53593 [Mycena albidolilacea]
MQSAAALEFPDLPNFLPNLRTVIISSSVFEPIEGSVRPWVGVTHLEMKFCMLSTAEDLWRLLCIFPALEHLHLSGWLVMDPDAPIVIAANAPAIHLKELVLLSSRHHSPHPAVAQLALHDLTVDRLSVTLLAVEDWDASACNSLLCKIGPTLQESWNSSWICQKSGSPKLGYASGPVRHSAASRSAYVLLRAAHKQCAAATSSSPF